MLQPPYQQLYIYYLKGRIQTDAALSVSVFIGNWEEEDDSFLFFSEPADALVNQMIGRQPGLTLVERFDMSYEAWQGSRITAYAVGKVFIKPPWDDVIPPPGKICLLMDPGVVFGNGQHPTTRDCLEALQLALDARSVSRVVDLGTGTGVLALAAAGLGADQVVAVDLNRLATQTAWRNVCLNSMQERIVVVQGNAKNFIDLACDLMVSNIHYAVMRPMLEMPGFRSSQQFILSGLLRSEALEIERLLRHQAARILRRWDQDETWFTFWGCNT